MKEIVINMREPKHPNARPIMYEINDNSCWNVISHPLDKNGYCKLTIKNKTYRMVRLVYCQFNDIRIEDFDSKTVVRHKCDNPQCVNPEHLEAGTVYENTQDKILRNRDSSGVKHGRTSLNEEQVKSIFYDKRRQIDIAADYGISQSRVSDIKRKETFSKLLEDL